MERHEPRFRRASITGGLLHALDSGCADAGFELVEPECGDGSERTGRADTDLASVDDRVRAAVEAIATLNG